MNDNKIFFELFNITDNLRVSSFFYFKRHNIIQIETGFLFDNDFEIILEAIKEIISSSKKSTCITLSNGNYVSLILSI